jgi:hypothetical protein
MMINLFPWKINWNYINNKQKIQAEDMLAGTTIQSDKIGLMGMLTLIPSYA